MTPRKSARKRARKSVPLFKAASFGERPYTIALLQKVEGGTVYARVYSHEAKRQVKKSLGHNDWSRAVTWAQGQAARLQREGEALVIRGPVTVTQCMTLYLRNRPAARSAKATTDDRRRAALWTRLLGSRVVETLGRAEWDRFVQLRSAGIVGAHGETVPAKERQPVGAAAVAHDLKFARAVFGWATSWNDEHGRVLLDRNPWSERPELVLPKNKAPRRPVATHDRYELVHAAAARVMMRVPKGTPGAELVAVGLRPYGRNRTMRPLRLWLVRSYLQELLELHEQTGRRRIAILGLRVADLVRAAGAAGPVTHLTWRPVKHEEGATTLPVSAETAATLERQLQRLRALGRMPVADAPLFPAPERGTGPLTEKVADEWLQKAEALAGVPPLAGGLWHPYRRKWASERTHLPELDVAFTGGWRDVQTMRRSYQTVDTPMIRQVVESPRKRREQSA